MTEIVAFVYKRVYNILQATVVALVNLKASSEEFIYE